MTHHIANDTHTALLNTGGNLSPPAGGPLWRGTLESALRVIARINLFHEPTVLVPVEVVGETEAA